MSSWYSHDAVQVHVDTFKVGHQAGDDNLLIDPSRPPELHEPERSKVGEEAADQYRYGHALASITDVPLGSVTHLKGRQSSSGYQGSHTSSSQITLSEI